MHWFLASLLTLTLQQPPVPPVPQPPAKPPQPPTVEVEVEEEIFVTATRTGRLASDQVVRVEVVNREEIEEKLLMTPGDIAMLLNETSGIRLQPTSPALGAASVRVQGMPGRFTAVLTDGLPINGTQVASVGLLQIPPMDLQQVEVIKGAASALYGPAALGGVINLVTRRPTAEHEGELLLNGTTRSGGDAILWASGPLSPRVGYTWLNGLHAQNAEDVDDDDWADLPRYRRFVTRPKLSFTTGSGTVDMTAGVTAERRRGGLISNIEGRQSINTDRVDFGATGRRPIGAGIGVVKATYVRLAHGHGYGEPGRGLIEYDDRHESAMVEGSMLWSRGDHTFVVGGGLDVQRYRFERPSGDDYTWTTPSLFLQDDVTLSDHATMSLSGRVDLHSEYGLLWSPRATVRYRPASWDVRLSVGRGAFAPTIFVEEVEEVGVHHVGNSKPDKAETAESASLDVTREFGPLSVSVTGFAAVVHDPVITAIWTDRGTRLEVFSATQAESAIKIHGFETFARVRKGPWVATATHTWLKATEGGDVARSRVNVPLTPRQTVGVIAAWEQHGTARVGFEFYYTGRQRLEDNPYRTESEPYTIIGMLAERRFGRVRVFVNLENLTNVRQSDYDPLLLPAPAVFGQRAVDAWAPLDGRTINAGVRIGF
jgi:outer membrane receptor for ferrienterochelin and colicins